jgi:hypothetical protein
MTLVDRTVPFTAGDGMQCSLINVRGPKEPTAGPVLLVHGAGVRGNIFRAPVSTNVVDLLVDAGYDVWLENWRASIDVPANRWTLDQAALYDHPAAVRKVVEQTGAREVKAIIHCQGSTSFAMSALAGLVPEVTTIVSNAVSLHPVVPAVTRAKMKLALPLLSRMTPWVDPQWGLAPPHALARVLTWLIRATHHECDNIVCRWSSFTYGVGFPTLWRHENLDDATHDWMQREFGPVSMDFFLQMAHCLDAGHLVSLNGDDVLPHDFAAQPPQTTARWALFSGELNRCFLPESQVRTHRWLETHRPGYHTLHIVPDYGHLDIFMGQHAARDVLPLMIEELGRQN